MKPLTYLITFSLHFLPWFRMLPNGGYNKDFCSFQISAPTRIDIYYPCQWKIVDGRRDGVKKVFVDSTGEETIIVLAFAVTKNYKVDLEKSKRDYSLIGIVKSIKETQIENLKTIEAITESNSERPIGIMYAKALNYSFVYRNYLIGITYSCQGLDQKVINDKFDANIVEYKLLASRTILLDKHQ